MRSSKLLRLSSNVSSCVAAGRTVSVRNLMALKKKALRRGLWYKVINRLDRVLVDLTLKVSKSINSNILIKGLLVVAQKLENAFESKLERATRSIGFPLAQKLSLLAQTGLQKAENWATDKALLLLSNDESPQIYNVATTN